MKRTVTVSWWNNKSEVSGEGFTVDQGTYSKGKQTSTLTVKGDKVNLHLDGTFTCRISSGSIATSGYYETTVNIFVYGKRRK